MAPVAEDSNQTLGGVEKVQLQECLRVEQLRSCILDDAYVTPPPATPVCPGATSNHPGSAGALPRRYSNGENAVGAMILLA
jgi:hypothetical protein